MTRRLSLTAPHRRVARIALLLLLLVTMGAQQWVIQTHWHPVAVAKAGTGVPGGHSGTTTDRDCLLCQIVSHAGAAAPPTVLHFVAAGHALVAMVASYNEAIVPAVPAHAWQSRGPPAA